jgi:hypothetical protein
VGGRADSGGLAMGSPSSARRHDEHRADRPNYTALKEHCTSDHQAAAVSNATNRHIAPGGSTH